MQNCAKLKKNYGFLWVFPYLSNYFTKKSRFFFKKSKIFRFIWKKDQRNGKKSVHLTSKKELVNKEAWPNEDPSAWEAFGMKVFLTGGGSKAFLARHGIGHQPLMKDLANNYVRFSSCAYT